MYIACVCLCVCTYTLNVARSPRSAQTSTSVNQPLNSVSVSLRVHTSSHFFLCAFKHTHTHTPRPQAHSLNKLYCKAITMWMRGPPAPLRPVWVSVCQCKWVREIDELVGREKGTPNQVKNTVWLTCGTYLIDILQNRLNGAASYGEHAWMSTPWTVNIRNVFYSLPRIDNFLGCVNMHLTRGTVQVILLSSASF